ncbi:MAG: hypothetical protein ABEJ26_04650 [Halosimplex sp.]
MRTERTTEDRGWVRRWVAAAVGDRIDGNSAVARLRAWYLDVDPRYRPVTAAAWGLALACYALGDTGLTTLVLALGGFEGNPVARAFLEALGYPGLAVQKALAVAALVAVWRHYPTVGGRSADPWRLMVPTVAAARGLQLVAIHLSNLAVLL